MEGHEVFWNIPKLDGINNTIICRLKKKLSLNIGKSDLFILLPLLYKRCLVNLSPVTIEMIVIINDINVKNDVDDNDDDCCC